MIYPKNPSLILLPPFFSSPYLSVSSFLLIHSSSVLPSCQPVFDLINTPRPLLSLFFHSPLFVLLFVLHFMHLAGLNMDHSDICQCFNKHQRLNKKQQQQPTPLTKNSYFISSFHHQTSLLCFKFCFTWRNVCLL